MLSKRLETKNIIDTIGLAGIGHIANSTSIYPDVPMSYPGSLYEIAIMLKKHAISEATRTLQLEPVVANLDCTTPEWQLKQVKAQNKPYFIQHTVIFNL